MPQFVGNMHGDEPLGRELVLLLADWLCDNYLKDSTVCFSYGSAGFSYAPKVSSVFSESLMFLLFPSLLPITTDTV